MIASLQSEGELKSTLCNTVRELPVTLEQIKQEALHNEYINQIKAKIFEKDHWAMEVFSICDEVLLYRKCVMISSTLQKCILKDFYAGHPGSARMKSLMWNYVHWPNMDKDIENAVKSCKACALAVKVSPIKFNPWLKIDLSWSRIHIDFTGSLEGYYYFIVVDSSSKWPEVLRCKNPTTEITIKFLHELFTRFGVMDTLVSHNGSQFMSGEFRDFCETYQIECITISLHHPRSNGQAERFVNTLKRALKKARSTLTKRALQQFLQIYRITPNNKTPTSQSSAAVMFACRIRSGYDKLLLKQTKPGRTCIVPPKWYNPRDSLFQNLQRQQVFLKDGNDRKKSWEI